LLCGILAQVAAVAPPVHIWYEAAGGGIVLGLSAGGLYSGAKAFAEPPNSRGTNSA
jgi:hypothetical protein